MNFTHRSEKNGGGILHCLRCGSEMDFFMREKIQLGQTGWFLGDLPNLIAGALELDIYICQECGKLEFFKSENGTDNADDDAEMPQTTCPQCGKTHDFDYPKCPYCGYEEK